MNPEKDDEIDRARKIVRTVVHEFFPMSDNPEGVVSYGSQEDVDHPIVVDGPIVVGRSTDEFGSDASGESYLSIWIVYDGEQDKLEVERTNEVMKDIRTRLIDAGIEDFPSAYWVEKTEWKRLFPKWRLSHPDLKVETT